MINVNGRGWGAAGGIFEAGGRGRRCLAVTSRAPRAHEMVTVRLSPRRRWWGAGGHALGGGVVEYGPRHGRDGDGDVLLQGAVAGRVIRHAVLPAAPEDSAPGPAEGADRAGVVVPAAAGGGVEVLGPGVVVAGAVRERADRPA